MGSKNCGLNEAFCYISRIDLSMDKYYKNKNSLTNCIVFIIFSTSPRWFYQYFILSLSNLNFCHFFLTGFQPSIKTSPPPTLFDLPYQQQTTGAMSLVDQNTWVFIFSVIAMNDYVSNFPSKQKFLHCNYKISTLVLQIHIPFLIMKTGSFPLQVTAQVPIHTSCFSKPILYQQKLITDINTITKISRKG